HAALDRGKSGRDLSAPNSGLSKDSFLARHKPVDPERFPLATPAVTEASGRLQPQRTDFGKRRAEENVLRSPEILSRACRPIRSGFGNPHSVIVVSKFLPPFTHQLEVFLHNARNSARLCLKSLTFRTTSVGAALRGRPAL